MSEHKAGAAAARLERLNAVDRAMRSVDRALRWMGYPGFETQLLVWLSGRLDVALLQNTLNRLAVVEPLIVSRLQERRGGNPCWLSNGNPAALIETTLGSDTREAVLDYAAQQLATPADPTTNNPIRFHVIRRRAAADVFLMQYNHTLMDNRGSIGIVQEINRLAGANGRDVSRAHDPLHDPTRRYLLRYPRARRRAAAQRAVDVWWRAVKGGAATPGQPGAYSSSPQRLRVLSVRLEPDQTLALRARAIAACGFPAISMDILAAAFRALDRLAGDCAGNRPWVAGIGIDLGLRRPGSGALHNLMSIVPMRVERSMLACHEELSRQLNEQMRSHLESEVDLGVLQLMTMFARRPHQMDWAVDHCLAHGFSIWYAYFGSLDAIGREFLGVPLNDISYFGPCWSPIGVTLLAQQFGGRLALQVTYLPELVSEEDANRFLALMAADIVYEP